MAIKTWVVELAVVTTFLGAVFVMNGASFLEGVGTVAVILTFCFMQVATRFEEVAVASKSSDNQAQLVHCHQWLVRYLVAKEIFWVVYFVGLGAWAPLAGTLGVFLPYGPYRRWYRKRNPLILEAKPATNGVIVETDEGEWVVMEAKTTHE